MRKTILTLAIAITMVLGVAASERPEPYFDNTAVVTWFNPTSFCKAIMKGDLDTVKKMIELGEDVNQKSLGMTPAHFAARYNQAEILEVLIDNGANLNRKCDKGYTVRKYAELSNAGDALKVLKTSDN